MVMLLLCESCNRIAKAVSFFWFIRCKQGLVCFVLVRSCKLIFFIGLIKVLGNA